MKEKFGVKHLIFLTVAYLVLVLIELAMDNFTGIHWTSPRDFHNILGLIAIGLLWAWYFADKFRKK